MAGVTGLGMLARRVAQSAARPSALGVGAKRTMVGPATKAAAAVQTTAAAGPPSLSEKIVHITFVSHKGERRTVPGVVGQTVADVAWDQDIDLTGPCGGIGTVAQIRRSDVWLEDQYGEGPVCGYCHVKIPPEWQPKLPEVFPLGIEEKLITFVDEYQYDKAASHLACQIKLSKELDGLVCFVVDGPPIDII